jgi:hypothetical protein
VWVAITPELSGLFVTNRAQNLHDARSFRTQHGPPARVHRADAKNLEIATGRIFIAMLTSIPFELRATPAEYKAGLDLAIARRLALAARERQLCQVYARRRRAVCMIRCTLCHNVGWVCHKHPAGHGQLIVPAAAMLPCSKCNVPEDGEALEA